ncbi:NAD-dependent epimerase/dehydratase family protein [Dehalococcoides mccartyi]
MTNRVFVTGGSGFVGRHLLPRLAENGFKIRLLVMNETEANRVKTPGVEFVYCTVNDLPVLMDSLKDVFAIIHLVAILRENKNATFAEVNIEGTKNILAAATENGVKRFIHMGILGASADPRFTYLHSKYLAEEAVRHSGLGYSILKPSVMFGPGAGFINALIRSFKPYPFIAPVAGNGKTRLQPIWVEDVVSCLLKMLEGEKIHQSVQIGGPQIFTYDQVLSAVMQAMRIKKPRLHVPVGLMRPLVWLMERASSNPPITMPELKALSVDNITVEDAVKREFGFDPKPLSEGLDYLKPAPAVP